LFEELLMRLLVICLGAISACAPLGPAQAGQAQVAVAANFTAPAKKIAADFKAATGHDLVLSFGASGQFAAQIAQAAPFEVFLSADAARPREIEKSGLAVQGARFVYAIGKLVLWSPSLDLADGAAVLKAGAFQKIAIANPNAAPYGAAALDVLRALKVDAAVVPKIVQGASIAQTYQFIASGNAELGFVALAQLHRDLSQDAEEKLHRGLPQDAEEKLHRGLPQDAEEKPHRGLPQDADGKLHRGVPQDAEKQLQTEAKGARWIVPQELYAPIRQEAVLLKNGANNEAARAFMEFLKSPAARRTIEAYGYGVE
jgi:molybdate transport system substrate-binding protein